jgi:CBS domain-containing protein
MVQLRDIMTTDVVTVSSDLSLQEAMELLATRHLSGAPVIAGGEIVGVISSTDLMGYAASLLRIRKEHHGDAAGDEEEQSDLTDDPESKESQEGDEPAATFFTELWTDTDAEVSEQFHVSTGSERNVFEESTVAEAMTMAVYALPPDSPINQAADLMRLRDIHRVLVMDGQRLLGIVTTKDIANAVADHKLTARTYVFGPPVDHGHK